MSEVGSARGSIFIDVSQPQTVPGVMQGVAQGINRAMSTVNATTNRATASLGGLAGAARGVAGALGVAFGAHQFASFVVDADRLATAYRRQGVAAEGLAGSQERLNELLQVYDEATGNALDRATALANVTKLLSVGFADSSEELDQFATAIRGISVAMGQTQDFVAQNLILELFSQRGARLDQLGLQYEAVRQRSEQLQAADQNLTRSMAYQQAVLEQAIERYGALADSAEGSATGLELLGKAWKNLQLAFGEGASGGANILFKTWANDLERAANELRIFFEWLDKINQASLRFRFNMGLSTYSPDYASGSGISDRVRGNTSRGVGAVITPRFNEEQIEALVKHDRALADIDRQAARDRQDATRQYESQRTELIADYEKQISREAEDFARSRANQERRLNLDILDVAQDSARQRVRWEAELNRTIAQARADSADRIADLEEDFQRAQARREEDFRDDLLSAAGRLDAIAMLELRKDRARQLQDAKRGHEERVADERESLDKSIRLQREAFDRQVAEQRDNDRLRIEEMRQAFAESRAQEDIERGIRLDRQAEDHQDQLDALDTAHADRLTQIGEHAQAERDKLDQEFGQSLEALGIKVDGFIKQGERATDAAIKNFDKWLKHIEEAFKVPPVPAGGARFNVPGMEIPGFARGGYVPRDTLAYLHRGEFVMPASQVAMGGSRSLSFSGDVNVTIAGSTNMGEGEMYRVARAAFVDALEEMSR